MYPTITGQGITRIFLIFLRPPHSDPKSSNNINVKIENKPITPWLYGNGKARLKSTIEPNKIHANENKRTKYQHAHTMHVKSN